jgi:glycosyltransferase involved in cell wall biosynthesis
MTTNSLRVLIVGQSFDQVTGGGITLSNLFKGWPKKSLAVVSQIIYPPNWDVCNQYYRIGEEESRLIAPLRWIWPYQKYSGHLIPKYLGTESASVAINYNLNAESGLVKVIHKITQFIGFQEIIRQIKLSPKLLAWLNDFRPDLIYTQASSLHSIRLVKKLTDYYQVPVVIHMMDDWPSTVYKNRLLSLYLRWRIGSEFLQLLKLSSGLMGISEKMCLAYQERYGYTFIPFQNPLDLNIWRRHARKDWTASIPFKLMYRGRIGRSIRSSLVDVCDVVYSLCQHGLAIRFDVYITPFADESARKLFERPNCVFVHPATSIDEVPKSLAAADLLVLCYDFDPSSKQFIRYSLPTKIPEYMASGTPVLVYSPADTTVVEYAIQSKWGYVVSEESEAAIKDAILNLMNNKSLREKLGIQSMKMAAQNHEGNKVREGFRKALVGATLRKPIPVINIQQ